MPNVRINSLKNRLYITLRDWEQADMCAYVQKIESACKELASGFHLPARFAKKRVDPPKKQRPAFQHHGFDFGLWGQ